MGHARHLNGLIGGLTVAFIVLEGVSWADPVVYYEPHSGYTETFDSANVPEKFQKLPAQLTTPPSKAGNATFAIAFEDVIDGSGIGFDDPALGGVRRGTALAVATYVNEVLNTTPGTAPTIDINFRASELDGTGFLASAGTFFPLSPNQYHNGRAFQHLTTGIDPSVLPDINVTVDFGRNWNSETDVPGGLEFDLATVLLHEYTHGLGFLGLTGSNGSSTISNSNPGVYSVLASEFVRIGTTTPLFNGSFSFVGALGDLTSNDVGFNGANAVAANSGAIPKIFSPAGFQSGSSLSHWDRATFPTEIMGQSFGQGFQQWSYLPLDIAALVDIGYTAAAASGEIEPVEPTASFTQTLTIGAAPHVMSFTDTSEPGSLPITTYLWDFGDPASGVNNTSSLENPTHIYGSEGTYTVTLTVINAEGSDVLTKTALVSVVGMLPANTVFGLVFVLVGICVAGFIMLKRMRG